MRRRHGARCAVLLSRRLSRKAVKWTPGRISRRSPICRESACLQAFSSRGDWIRTSDRPAPSPRDLAAMGPAGPCLLSCRAAESARVALTLDPKLDHKRVFVLAAKTPASRSPRATPITRLRNSRASQATVLLLVLSGRLPLAVVAHPVTRKQKRGPRARPPRSFAASRRSRRAASRPPLRARPPGARRGRWRRSR